MKKTILLALSLAIVAISLLSIVHAHTGETEGWGMWNMMGINVDEMDETHEYTTRNLDPELMDEIHERCILLFE